MPLSVNRSILHETGKKLLPAVADNTECTFTKV
jgi:hypothetical protein